MTPTTTDVTSLIGGAGITPAPASAPPGTVNPDGVSGQTAQAQQPAASTPPSPDPATAESVLTWDKVTLPEGVVIEEPVQAEFLTIFNNRELSAEQRASELLSLHGRMMESVAAEMVQEWEKTQADWRAQVHQMPEFQGGPPEKHFSEIARIVNRYGGPDARKAFDLTGAGNHPAIVRMLLKIAKDINEEAPVSGTQPPAEPLSRADRLYGNQGG